jgi:hypothetical protein
MYASAVSKRAVPKSRHRELTPGRFIIYYSYLLKRDTTAICTTTRMHDWVKVINLHTSIRNRRGMAHVSQIKVIGEMAQYQGSTIHSNQTGPIE